MTFHRSPFLTATIALGLASCAQPVPQAAAPAPPVAADKKPVRMNGRGEITSISLTDQYSGTLLYSDLNGVWDLTSGTNTWQFTEATGNLSLTVIPEPNVTILSCGMALLALLRRRRN